MDDAEITSLLESPATKMMEIDADSTFEVNNFKAEKLAGEGGSSLEDNSTPAPELRAPTSACLVSGMTSGTGEQSEKGGLALNRARRTCTLNSSNLQLRSSSLSTTSRRPVKGSGGAKSSIDDSSKPLVDSKKSKCQKKVSDYFPKN